MSTPLPAHPRPRVLPSCAVVLSNAVGDSVMMMALVNNMVRNGYSPKVFGRVAQQLVDWFPWCDIVPVQPPPETSIDQRVVEVGLFDVVIELYQSRLGDSLSRTGKSVALHTLPGFKSTGDLTLDRIVRAGASCLGLSDIDRSTGIVLPTRVTRLLASRRVVIHPTASHPEKMWDRSKFVALAQALIRKGLEPCFIVMPSELEEWRQEQDKGVPVFAFLSLDGIASVIAEAGWFIGNDSGPGHLASALGVPTVSLFMRRGLARTWRPGWGQCRVVLPPNLLPGARLRERFWQRMLSVRRVLRHFDDLQRHDTRAAPVAHSNLRSDISVDSQKQAVDAGEEDK